MTLGFPSNPLNPDRLVTCLRGYSNETRYPDFPWLYGGEMQGYHTWLAPLGTPVMPGYFASVVQVQLKQSTLDVVIAGEFEDHA